MARPIKGPPQHVYRIWLDRPERKDSVVRFTTLDPETIRNRYKERLLSIDRYTYEGKANA